jgi:hypothetical protein
MRSRRRWHGSSVFGSGPRAPLCREQRAQFRAKLQLQRRPGRLTLGAAVVGRVLVDMLGTDGRLDPALTTIATRARVSVATVKRALVQLRDFGFLSWTRRLISDATSGWRIEQASNGYRLSVPATEVHFAHAVIQKVLSKVQQSRPLTDREARINAARQLRALGAVVPGAWGNGGPIGADDLV